MKTYKETIKQLIEDNQALTYEFNGHLLHAGSFRESMEVAIKSLTAKVSNVKMELTESNRLNEILKRESKSAVEIRSLTHANFNLNLRVLELEATIRVESTDET